MKKIDGVDYEEVSPGKWHPVETTAVTVVNNYTVGAAPAASQYLAADDGKLINRTIGAGMIRRTVTTGVIMRKAG